MLALDFQNHKFAQAESDIYTDEEYNAMQRAVLRLFELWKISDAQSAVLLGGISPKTFSRWRKGEFGRMNIDQADRISHILAIHKSLRILFTEKERVYKWVSRKNDVFEGKSALDVMLKGHLRHIERVRFYLDSVRGGW
ncbi:MAG: MbcA/ParS/Xre antitoxin family protein [Opitutales bacterium]